jgi:hypothetical protein
MASHPAPADHILVLYHLITDNGMNIQKIKASPNGIRLTLGSPNETSAAAAVAANHGWIVTRSVRHEISIEPYYPDPIFVLEGTTLFHASLREFRNDILKEGLQPQSGGGTNLDRNYPDRVHLATTLSGVLTFVDHQTTSPFNHVWGQPSKAAHDLKEMDVYVLDAPAANYYPDSHFEAHGIWTEASVPPEALRLLRRYEWVPLFKQLHLRDRWPTLHPRCLCLHGAGDALIALLAAPYRMLKCFIDR